MSTTIEAKPSTELFRISVNMERYFSDERSRCYVVARGDRRVRWLVRRLRRRFALGPCAAALLLRGHLLPPAEPLTLLRPDDTLHLVPVEEDWYNRLDERIISSDEDTEEVQTAKPKNSPHHQYKHREETHRDVEEVDITLTSNHIVESSPFICSNLQEHNQIFISDEHDKQTVSGILACSNNMDEESDEDDSLLCSKKRAFALLEGYSRTACNASEVSAVLDIDAVPARRRRIRRRKRRTKVLLDEVDSSSPAGQITAAPSNVTAVTAVNAATVANSVNDTPDSPNEGCPTGRQSAARVSPTPSAPLVLLASSAPFAPPVLRNQSAQRRGPRSVRSLSPQPQSLLAIPSGAA